MRRKLFFCVIMMLLIPLTMTARKKKTTSESKEVKKETAYEKLFKGKACETKKGMITLHKMEGKIYFEIPLSLLGKEMLIGSTITAITDNNFGSVGEKPKMPLHVTFMKTDSVVSLCELSSGHYTPDANIAKRLEESHRPAIMQVFPVKAYSADSSAVVVDMTDFLLSDEERLNPFTYWAPATIYPRQLQKVFQKNNSQIESVKAFDDNISVQSALTYTVSVRDQMRFYYYQMPFTVVMTRSFILLPEEKMRPRLADPRISIFYQGKMEFDTRNRGMEGRYYAQRWRLEPVDEAAYRQGKLVDVKEPIVFYVDDAFPENWKQAIKEGVEVWQDAFEKIGLKNAIVARDFPKDDPEFDPDNLKYSCIRYSPSWIANAMGPSWTDPRTGEIINASVYLYHNLVKLVQDWRFIHTAAVDPDVRRKVLDPETLHDCIRYVVSHEVGHCLSFMHNMSASAAIPVDSLRSPSFTQKYGTTYSIMDYARNNYVAQPGDKERGVRLTPPRLGVYDYYTIKWLYTPLPDARSSEEEVPTLDRWISEKAGDPAYRYGMQQFGGRLDPSSFEEDLGDDAMKAATYGIKNLKYILANLNEWVAADDKDYTFRQNIYNELIYQYFRYLNHVIYNIGGIYINQRYDGDPLPFYEPVSREKQERALRFMLAQLKDMDWLDAPGMQKTLPLMKNISGDLENAIFQGIMSRVGALFLCMEKTDRDHYTPGMYMNQIFDFVFAPTRQGKILTGTDMRLQTKYLSHLITGSKVTVKGMGGQSMALVNGLALEVPEYIKAKSREVYGVLPVNSVGIFTNQEVSGEALLPEEIQGFGAAYTTGPMQTSMEAIYFDILKKARALLKSKINTGSEETRIHYKLLIHKLDQALES
ncbi:zinc-dependent metalloprotease [Butyricimonas synergistica]|uniref:zinc-dependent metalloprotease n=1 Tax=Butyricimonas synergistica TaxID=544644 RepID=UPI0003A3442A|nr:zinc-dependent metalloprotease [Butyricimonas synergistica]